MPLHLYLARHAEALTSDEDPTRPLNSLGRKNASHMASFLKQAGVSFNHIYHSARKRAKETAEIYDSELSTSHQLEYFAALDPEENLYHLCSAIGQFSDKTLLVGHLPNLELFANFLLTGSYDKPTIHFAPASVACFTQEGNSWLLKWLVGPSLIAPPHSDRI